MHRRALFLVTVALLSAPASSAHPMGNLSVNRYVRLQPSAQGVDVSYVLDLGEIPSFELLQRWGVSASGEKGEKNVQGDAKIQQGALETKARAAAEAFAENLVFTENGQPLAPELRSAEAALATGTGNLPTVRVRCLFHVPAKGGRFEYQDRNYLSRTGWSEIAVAAGAGALVATSTRGDTDITKGLTSYPAATTAGTPNSRRAWFEWQLAPGITSSAPAPRMVLLPEDSGAPTAAPAPSSPVQKQDPTAAPKQAGEDRVSRLTEVLRSASRNKDLSLSVFAALLCLAFWFGALHALEPGHGKTMAAAYLVGSRGTPKHALILGASVTFTHTVSVFLLGLVTMFLSQYIMPDKITKWLGVISGLSIIWIGGMLLWKRWRALRDSYGNHRSQRSRAHAYAHAHGMPHRHGHRHGPADHAHSHVPEEEITMSSLIALGASGGLVPCPSALILLLSAVSVGRPALGMLLLLAFSLGLAIVLTATGLTVLYAKNLLPENRRTDNALFRYMPVISAAAILLVGVLMTGASMGWLPTVRLFG